ncbi:MAG: chromosome segregation SMC family protein [Spirochaetota bacterium]
MVLKSIELFGFKSFADRSKLEFSPGITSLLGPNGCGKSNIVDAIKWVLGEQSIKTLRAGKMEDVIFNGTQSRKKLQVSEVILVISNEQGYLPLDVSEIAIKRRMYRSGESEYFINNAPVRLKEVKELFYDTGVGKTAYSILEQGKIDQILSQRPEDRRYIFEEAAGITRFKQRQQEAERKLVRTDEHITRVQGILKEVKQTYDTRRGQAEKAKRYQELEQEVFRLEVELQLVRVQTLKQRIENKQKAISEAQSQIASLTEQETHLQQQIDSELEQMNRLSKERIEVQNQLHRMDESKTSRKNQLELLTERVADFQQAAESSTHRIDLISQRIDKIRRDIESKRELYDQTQKEYEQTQNDRHICGQTIQASEERIEGNTGEHTAAEQELAQIDSRQVELGRRLQEITESIAKELDSQLISSGYSAGERSNVEKEIIHRLESLEVTARGRAALLQDAAKIGSRHRKELLKGALNDFETIEQELNSLNERVSEYIGMLPRFIDDFLSPAGIMTKKRDIDTQIEKLYERQAEVKQHITQLKEEKQQLEKRLTEYRKTYQEAELAEVRQKDRLENLSRELQELRRKEQEDAEELESERKVLKESEHKQAETQEKIRVLQETTEVKTQEEHELKTRNTAIGTELDSHSSTLATLRSELQSKQQARSEASQGLERAKAEIASLQEEMEYIYSTFEEDYAKSLHEYEGRTVESSLDHDALRRQLKHLKEQVASLGYVNHMAAEEFSEVKERYEFLHKQLRDLEQAKEDLQTVTQEITARSQVLFEESYAKIKKNFHAMFRRLFGGGRAELRLVDPNDVLNTGIDIFAQPPGKKLEKISLLSGGERSMTAVALLFATYLVKPAPFCILDEIDAALDDANIGYFLDMLREFSEKSQFIIITHNKKTVLGSGAMLGVTMQEAGVSKVVSYRLTEDVAAANHG